nr:putative reverse transcriptase domain-containing protein [Tanacetum cinerariifolium]
MPLKSAPLTQAAIRRMIKDNVDAAIAAKRDRQANVRNKASGSRPARGQDAAPATRKCTFAGFMKCNPTAFCCTKGAIELLRWFEKTKSVFGISECVEGKKNLKVKEYNIVAYTQRFNELALICPRMVDPERVKSKLEMKESWKERSESGRAFKVEIVVAKAFKGITHVKLCRITKGKETRELWLPPLLMESFLYVNDVLLAMLVSVRSSATSVERLGTSQGTDVQRRFLLNNRYAFVLFDSVSDRSFVDTRFSSMLDIDSAKIGASYEVELADGRVVSTNTVLKGFTLNLVNHEFKIDLMLIELGTFDIIIGMDWLVKHDAVIVCGERVVHIPYGNKMLIVKINKGVSRLKVISCIKARKYVKRGCHLFLVHVMEDKSKEKRMEDVPMIPDFPKVFPEEFPEELPGLPPPRQVEF